MSEKQFSKNWELIKATDKGLSLQERVNLAIGSPRQKFPYSEGFPKTPYDIDTARFGLVVPKLGWLGFEEVEAVVDISTQYRAEGRRWQIKQGTNEHHGTIGDHLVIAWYEK